VTRVYVDMVADRFAAGHEAFLREARGCGDELIVGVLDDDDCEWFDRRPRQVLDQRAQSAASCTHVDRVIAGGPVFPDPLWLAEQGIDRLVHWDGLPVRASRYWYRAAAEAGLVRPVVVPGARTDFDPHGRTHVPDPAPETSDSVLAPFRRRFRRWLPPAAGMLRRRVLADGLRRLADALRGTPLAGRFWVVGGLLLGWARQGGPLHSDLEDADFAYLDQDHDRFLDSVAALVRAGFRPRHRFSSAGGRYVEHRFRRGGVQYDFFRLAPAGDRFRYSMFVQGEEPAELVAEVPAQERVPFRLVDRDWLKVADHDLALRSIYGDWRTDRPDWSFVKDRAIVERIPMSLLPIEWNWPNAVARGPGER